MNTPLIGITQNVEFELFDKKTGTQLIRTSEAWEAANLYNTLTREGYAVLVCERTTIEERKEIDCTALIVDDLDGPETQTNMFDIAEVPASEPAPRMAPLVRNPKPRK